MSHTPQSTDETLGPASPVVHLGLLVVLLVFGLGLAIGGSAFGVGIPLADDEGAGAVDIGESQITVNSSEMESITVEEDKPITAVEIQEKEGIFKIETERTSPFTEQERERIIDLVKQNTTVKSTLEDLAAYEFEVEPFGEETLSSGDSNEVTVGGEVNVNITDSSRSDDGARATENETALEEGTEIDFSVERVDTADNDTIQVDRTPSYSDEKALVTVQDRETGTERLTVKVDVIDETVLSITER